MQFRDIAHFKIDDSTVGRTEFNSELTRLTSSVEMGHALLEEGRW